MDFEVIIIGGSYAGLSAALALGRAKRKVLIVDSGKPCNKQTPYSHNFLTHDGEKPAEISSKAKAEVLKYPTISFIENAVSTAKSLKDGFSIGLKTGQRYASRKLLITTGLKDVFPEIKGFAACWGISLIHCPYCHGFEVSGEKIGLLMNGDNAFEMAKNLNHWNKDLTILTNGKSEFTEIQLQKLKSKSIKIIEDKIEEFEHVNGELKSVVFSKGEKLSLKAIYAKADVQQHTDLHLQLGFELTEFQTIKVDQQQQTTTVGVYAAGDCTTLMRSLSIITAAGTLAAVMINKEMIAEDF